MVDVSVIIVSYNTCELTQRAIHAILASLEKSPTLSYEIIVVDNASTDESVTMLKAQKNIALIENTHNFGYGAANNIGIQKAQGTYILLLNSDVIADRIDFSALISYMQRQPNIGVLTVRVELEYGGIDPASHRGFPTIWRAFCYYAKFEKLFGAIPLLSRLFGGYHLTYLDLHTTHEIDSPAGAFYLSTKKILDQVHGFDEAFFMYGEDLDLSYRIKEKGYKVVYYPAFTVVHLKHQSGLKKNTDTIEKRAIQHETKKHFYHAMKIFYDKHHAKNNPSFVNTLIHLIIDAKARI